MNFRLKQFESAQRDAHKPKAVRINNMQLGIISAINKTNAASRSQTGSHLNQLKAPVQHLAHYRQKAFCLHAMCCAYLPISAHQSRYVSETDDFMSRTTVGPGCFGSIGTSAF